MSFITGETIDLKYPDDFVASSARLQSEIKIDNSISSDTASSQRTTTRMSMFTAKRC